MLKEGGETGAGRAGGWTDKRRAGGREGGREQVGQLDGFSKDKARLGCFSRFWPVCWADFSYLGLKPQCSAKFREKWRP